MFTLDYKSRKPLYDQLCESVERMAACGVLTQGCRLPSVRVLAEELAINPNTVQKAYRMLERNGIIQTVPGKGSFAAPHTGVDESRRASLFQVFDQAASELLFLGVSGEVLRQRVRGLEGGMEQ